MESNEPLVGAPPSDARNWAMAAHLAALIGLTALPAVLGPLLVWLLKRGEHPFVDEHGREAVNFNLTILLVVVIGIVVAMATLGIALIVLAPIGALVGLAWLVLTILAAVRASNGEPYRYPLTLRLVR